MIENKLNYYELNTLLSPFLRLDPVSKILSEIEEVFTVKLNSIKDIENYSKKYFISYNGFRFDILGLGELSDNSVYIHFQFRIENKWYYRYRNPTTKVVEDLKKICLKELKELSFSNFEYDNISFNRNHESRSDIFLYYYDSAAFNSEWKEGKEISSLLISPSINEKYYFVEFIFNSSCYKRSDDKTFLKEDWFNYIWDIEKYIIKEASELLKYGFNENK